MSIIKKKKKERKKNDDKIALTAKEILKPYYSRWVCFSKILKTLNILMVKNAKNAVEYIIYKQWKPIVSVVIK